MGREGSLSHGEEVILAAIRKILAKNDNTKDLLCVQLGLVAQVAGVSILEEMDTLRRCSFEQKPA